VSGQLQECRAGGKEFQIVGDVTEKLRAPNASTYACTFILTT